MPRLQPILYMHMHTRMQMCMHMRMRVRHAHAYPHAYPHAHVACHRLASGLLALHVLLVGAAFVGLPVSAAVGYGPEMAAYVVAAVACGVCAAVGLALLVLVTQACHPSYVVEAAALGAGGCKPRCTRLLP